MARFSALASLLVWLVVPSTAMSGPSAKEIEINGVRLPYVEQGSGEPIVFVHGAFSDLRVWEPIREEIAKRYRFIALTQRYFGTSAWPDEGKNFGGATHADDLARFIASLNAGPVHLIGRSYGGGVATNAALKNPSLVRTLTVHEPALLSVLPADSAEGKAAREDRKKFVGPAVADAAKAGDSIQAVRLFFEGVYQLGPGGFDRLPQATQTMILDNARTAPLLFGSPPAPAVTCDALKALARPTHAATDTVEQRYSEIGFERLKLTGGGRLAQMQPSLGARQASGIGNGDEGAELAKVHNQCIANFAMNADSLLHWTQADRLTTDIGLELIQD
jgi:pimeloyl-ACP methyl ester carboxylesterase